MKDKYMKTYFDCMNEIDDGELYESLLGYGMISEMIPPFLTSEKFYNYCKRHPQISTDGASQYIGYNAMRNINVPRPIGVPSPFTYQRLCKVLSENWQQIKNHFKTQTESDSYKRSRIHIRKMKDKKKIFEMNYDNWRTDGTPEVDLLCDNKYIIHADISNCFNSIYTHAISWALVGKETAKGTATETDKWYNQIDFATRNCRYGETNGILIGPHASNILSEIILTAIDKELSAKWNYFRNIDDYTCYVKNMDDAHKFLIDLGSVLKKYNLSLNNKKTEIKELPISLSEHWTHQLDNISVYYRNEYFDYKSIKAYLDNAVSLMKDNNNNAAILNYAIKSIPAKDMSPNAKSYCNKYILHLCLLYPYLLRIVDQYVFQKFEVPIDIIKKFTNNVYNRSIEIKNFEGVSYAIYFALKYNLTIDDIKSSDIIDGEDCITCLLAYLYFNKNNAEIDKTNLYDYAKKLDQRDDDFYQNWVFVYEVLTRKDLSRSDWKGLKKDDVTFIKKSL